MTLRRYIEIKDIIGIAFDKDRSEMSPAELLTDFFTPGDWIKDAIAKLGSEYDIWLSINPDTCEVALIAAQMALTAREACTVLAALRHWQLVSDPKGQSPDHFEDAEPLSAAGIDELCERINVEWLDESQGWPDGTTPQATPPAQPVASLIEAELEDEPDYHIG